MKEDLYKVLEIDKGADDKQIKKAYRTLAKKYHPDKNPDDEKAENKFKEVSYAYEILSDETKRAKYNQYGHKGFENGGGRGYGDMSMDDIFNSFGDIFGERQQRSNKQRYNIKVALQLTPEEVYTGVEKKFTYHRIDKCEPCNGQGGENAKHCPSCDGQGRTFRVQETPRGYIQRAIQCPDCNGNGKTFESICKSCNTEGVTSNNKTIKIKIPHSLMHGEHITLNKKGHYGDGHTGDLLIYIQVVRSNNFEIGNDYSLLSNINVPYEKLMVGGKIKFKTIDGSSVMVTIPKMSKIGSKLKLSGKGLKHSGYIQKFAVPRGDQYLVINIEIPTTISKEEEELLNKIKKIKE